MVPQLSHYGVDVDVRVVAILPGLRRSSCDIWPMGQSAVQINVRVIIFILLIFLNDHELSGVHGLA